MPHKNCDHCGLEVLGKSFVLEEKEFCCLGCKTVFQILTRSKLETFYQIQPRAGNRPPEHSIDYTVLDQVEIKKKWIQFQDHQHSHCTFIIPGIHCSACIWILEQIHKLVPGIGEAHVHFSSKELLLIFDHHKTSLKIIAEHLANLGYPPELNYNLNTPFKKNKTRKLLKQIAVAGFAFANCMLLSFPAYFDSDEIWVIRFHLLFNSVMALVSVFVVFYSAQDYFISAWKGIKHKFLTLDVPIAIGVTVLFITSIYNAFIENTLGYFDSLSGFVFFLLLGKYLQAVTYNTFSFERDYKSFFPMAVQKKTSKNTLTYVLLEAIKKGDHLFLKPSEIIPVDGILESEETTINYSFVTGESNPIRVQKGDLLYAGGKIEGKACSSIAASTIMQSRLIQLWNQDSFRKNGEQNLNRITNQISRYFTPTVLFVSLIVGVFWTYHDPSRLFETITAVLIVACPCALALSAPFVLSNMLRYFGRQQFFLKNTASIERLSEINHLVFDKTGTLTDHKACPIQFIGTPLNTREASWIRSLASYSSHPLSFQIAEFLDPSPIQKVIDFRTEIGKGVQATLQGTKIRMGKPNWIDKTLDFNGQFSWVAIEINANFRGVFQIQQPLRPGLQTLFSNLQAYSLSLVSGDKKENKIDFFDFFDEDQMHFEQDPFQKIYHIKSLQQEAKKVAMIGDGLNDAGALKQSDFGLAVALYNHAFTPACDAIITAENVPKFHHFLWATKKSLLLIKISFVLSLIYNLIGLGFAATGQLNPIIAAILMPASSISVVLFASASTAVLYKKLEKKLKD